MKKSARLLLAATSIALAAILPLSSEAQSGHFSPSRFEALIQAIENSLTRAARMPGFYRMPAPDQADLLARSGVRVDAMNLQSMGRLYEEAYPKDSARKFAKAIRKSAKDLEDLMGQYDKMKSVGKKKQAEEAAAALVQLLQKEQWLDGRGRSPIVSQMRAKLAETKWLTDDQDRDFAFSRLIMQLEKVRSSRYDMRRLEAGLHELRRELRWFTISALALGGLVIASPAVQCPLTRALFAKDADSKYSFPVTSSLPNPCVISACLTLEITGAVGTFGKMKDQAEPIVENDERLLKDDLTPPNIAVAADRAYRALLQSDVLGRTSAQIQSCMKTR